MGHRIRLRAAFLLAAALAASLPSPPAPAAFSGHLEPLESWLAAVDAAPPEEGVPPRVDRRRHRASARALLLLHRPADDLGDDLRTFLRLTRLLRSGWRGEGPGALASPAAEPVEDALDRLRGALDQDLDFLAASCGGRPEGTRLAVDSCIDRARTHLARTDLEGADAGSLPRRVHHLLKARREWERGAGILEAEGPVPVAIAATLDGQPVPLDEVLVSWSPATGSLSLSGIGYGSPTASLVAMAAEPVEGPGTYPLVVASLDVGGSLPLLADSGTLEVLAFDATALTLSLRVVFTGEGPPGSGLGGDVVLEYTGPFFPGD